MSNQNGGNQGVTASGVEGPSQYWLFVDSKTRAVSRRLSQQGAEDFIRNLQNISIDHWWAWNPCFREWIPLKNIIHVRNGKVIMLIQLPESAEDEAVEAEEKTIAGVAATGATAAAGATPTGATPPESTHIPEEYSEVRNYLRDEMADDLRDFHGDDLTISGIPKPPALGFGSDRRNSRRVNKRIEVVVAGRGKSFRAHTVNISLTGLMLDKPLPLDLQSGPFEIIFILQEKGSKKQIAFQAKVSGDLRDRTRLVFGELSAQSRQVLENLFTTAA